MLLVERLSPDARVPHYATEGAIGLDLCAVRDVTVSPGGCTPVPTGIAIAIPNGYYGRIAPKSGLALRYAIDVLAGVIDSDYRGEVIVLLTNHGRLNHTFHKGEKVAQLILERADQLPVQEVMSLDATARGERGFGSSGL